MDSVKDESILKHLNVEAALCQIWPASIAKDFQLHQHRSNQEKLGFSLASLLSFPQSICSSLKGHEEGPQNSDTVKKHKWPFINGTSAFLKPIFPVACATHEQFRAMLS